MEIYCLIAKTFLFGGMEKIWKPIVAMVVSCTTVRMYILLLNCILNMVTWHILFYTFSHNKKLKIKSSYQIFHDLDCPRVDFTSGTQIYKGLQVTWSNPPRNPSEEHASLHPSWLVSKEASPEAARCWEQTLSHWPPWRRNNLCWKKRDKWKGSWRSWEPNCDCSCVTIIQLSKVQLPSIIK